MKGLVVVPRGPEGLGGPEGPEGLVLVLVLREGCLGKLIVLAMLGILGIGALASVLALALICLVTCSKLTTYKAIIAKIVYSLSLSVYSQNTLSKSSNLDYSALDSDNI